MVSISLKLPKDLNNRVRFLADKRKASASQIVRNALAQYLASEPEAFQGSVLDLALDLIGSLDGPPDLSTNKKTRKGYGR